VVGVTQYEAAAYCAWLTEQVEVADLPGSLELSGKLAARLPTEEEWERAARGTDGRTYPWGDAFDFGKANVAKRWGEGIGTMAVCTYPQGVSPVGAWDMSGNVWEWTSPEAVIRGGSWYGNEGYARCAYRLRYNPDLFISRYGFRVVVSLRRS